MIKETFTFCLVVYLMSAIHVLLFSFNGRRLTIKQTFGVIFVWGSFLLLVMGIGRMILELLNHFFPGR